eukprot:gene10346-21585_t
MLLRFRLSQLKWCLAILVFIMINFHISLFLIRSYDFQFYKVRLSTALNIEISKDKDPDPVILDSTNKNALPVIASDESEIIFGAVIEREFDSQHLFLTSFFLSHFMLTPKDTGARNIRGEDIDLWKRILSKSNDVKYTDSGTRLSFPKYFCHITNALGSERYLVMAEFVPNRLSVDANSNRRLDIMRCKMQYSEQAYRDLSKNLHNGSVLVEILREENSIARFEVPWSTRRAGYTLFTPASKLASNFDAWKGYDPSSNALPGSKGGDRLHMCVPGFRRPPSKEVMPRYLEFVQHHLLLGVDHIFLGTSFSWKSTSMTRMLEGFRSFIDEGSVSVASQAGDGIDNVLSVKGLTWHRIDAKTFFVNMCLYLSKGTADYVAIWDLDEFFIPRRPYNDMLEVLRAMEAPGPIPAHPSGKSVSEIYETWRGGPGLADGMGHPFCYILLNSLVLLNKEQTSGGGGGGGGVNPGSPWIGDVFSHGPEPKHMKINRQMGFKKSILPTRTIFQAGLHMNGACKLESQWTPCGGTDQSDNCYAEGVRSDLRTLKNGTIVRFHLDHHFDESVMDEDAKRVDIDTQAVIYHLQPHRGHLVASSEALQSENEYTSRFFPIVMKRLKDRGLDNLGVYPVINPRSDRVDASWLKFDIVYNMRLNSNQLTSRPSDAGVKKENTPSKLSNPLLSKPLITNDLQSVDYIKKLYSDLIPRVATLPSFVVDETDMALGAVIERVHESWDMYLTTIFLGRSMTAPVLNNFAMQQIQPSKEDFWKRIMLKFDTFKLSDIGIRVPLVNHYCRISNSAGSRVYTVLGEFIPNRLTPDSNANRRFEIFRCKMQDTERAYRQLARTSASVSVEILRESVSLINFTVPWDTRRTGYMLSMPVGMETTNFDEWTGYKAESKDVPGSRDTHRLHMCVPCMENVPSRASLPMYIEFV